MKKSKKLIFILSIILLTLACSYFIIRHKYYKTIHTTYEELVLNAGLILTYDNYYEFCGEYPSSVEQLIDTIMKYGNFRPELTSEEIRGFKRSELAHKDYFSRNKSAQTIYIPLYNRETNKRESYLFLSAGIDGKINYIHDNSKIHYIDSWWEDLDIYNYDQTILLRDIFNKSTVFNRWDNEGIDISDHLEKLPFPNLKVKFNLLDYFFGKSDYVVTLGSPNMFY